MRAYQKMLLSLFLTVVMVFPPVSLTLCNTATVQAATIKISKKTLTLEKGKTKTLKISGTKKKMTWSSSNEMVAAVSSKGKVTAKAVGTATITASVSGKKLTCEVTVVKPANPYLKNAPFHAVETNLAGYNFVMPSDWISGLTPNVESNGYVFTLAPPEAAKGSKIEITILLTEKKAPSFSTLKKEVTDRLTPEKISDDFSKLYKDSSFEVKNFTQEKYEAAFAQVMKTQYSVVSDSTLEQSIYDFYLDNYFLEIKTFDYEQLGLSDIAEYVISSMQKE